MDRDAWKSNWKHLRVTFQLTLAPIFLWGALLSESSPTPRMLLAFFVFHFILYTGITAYNSAFDRDEGPIGGLERPPAVHSTLLPLSIALKAAGFALSLLCGASLAAIYVVFVVLSVLYSHPRTRWKAHAGFSALVACLGQGMLGYLAGWSAAAGSLAGFGGDAAILGMLTAGFTTLGMYLVTQVYQIEEDARRGDHTLSVILGPERALRLAQGAFVAAGATAVTLCWRRFGQLNATVMAAAYICMLATLEAVRGRFALLDRRAAFRTAMRFVYGGSAAFAAFILFEWRR